MKSLLLFFTLGFVILSSTIADAHGQPFKGDQVLRLSLVNEDQLHQVEELTNDFALDFWKVTRFDGISVDVRVPLKHVHQLKSALRKAKIAHSIFIDDVQRLIDNQRTFHPKAKDLSSFDYEVYHPFEEIQRWIDDMVTEYPELASKDVVGTTFEGRVFSAIKISTRLGNPQFVINCGIHAREWVSPATCMYSAMLLVTGYRRRDASIRYLLNNVDFVFIPSSNPDGYVHTWSEDRMWRKTRSTENSDTCVGVDPNRNWDSHHCGEGSSTDPCSNVYCGPKPFSEPCVLAQKNFVESLPNVKMYIDVHSYSQLWMFPYGYTYKRPADFEDLDKIAQDSVYAIKQVHGESYTAGQHSTTIYIASGITADYYYDKAGIKCAFLAELRDTGRYGFLLPEDQIKPTAEESFEAFKVMAKAIIDGNCA